MLPHSYFIFANPLKPETTQAADYLAHSLLGRGAEVALDTWLHDKLGIGKRMDVREIAAPMTAIVSLGGDGTLLRTVAVAARNGIPVLGINMGHVGFLMEAGFDTLEDIPDKLIKRQYFIEERMMLTASVAGGESHLVMNDLALVRGHNPSSIRVQAWADDELIFTVHGDGILVSTPTGTTGYSLSAGGPVISPLLECIAVVPVCSHVLHHRPVVLPVTQQLMLRMEDVSGRTNQLIVDGQTSLPVTGEIAVSISRAAERARFIRFGAHRFLSRLRKKQSEWSME